MSRLSDALSLADIEKTIVALGVKARNNKLTMDDLGGGIFSITNGGVFGSMMSTPILNPPQAAILGIFDHPVVVGGQISERAFSLLWIPAFAGMTQSIYFLNRNGVTAPPTPPPAPRR